MITFAVFDGAGEAAVIILLFSWYVIMGNLLR